jgi:hypothetical protein
MFTKKTLSTFIAGSLLLGMSSTIMAAPILTAEKRPADEIQVRPNQDIIVSTKIEDYDKHDPKLKEALKQHQNSHIQCTGFWAPKIAFSAVGTGETSFGGTNILFYNQTITNEPPINNTAPGFPWTGATFIVPCNGLYYFTVSFVRDSRYRNGDHDDVMIQIKRNGVIIGNPGGGNVGAWAGETSTPERATGTYSVIDRLEKGDLINTWVYSDGGRKRHLPSYYFSGFRL